MIKYLLRCKQSHEFESWFSNSKEYEKLNKRKLIECIFCKSKEVDKSIMSPNISAKNISEISDINKDFFKFKKDLLKTRRYIEKNFEFVGDKFPREAREIYYDNKNKNKNIYGTASLKERLELEEEGIELTSIPWIENNKNN